MIELSYMIIDEMGTDKDEAGAVMSATAHCEHEENTQCVLHLPPSLRPNQCDIKRGARVLGAFDTDNGVGVALVGLEGAFWGYRVNGSKGLSVEKDVSVGGALSVKGSKGLSVEKDVSVGGALSVKGDVSGKAGASFVKDVKTKADFKSPTVSLNTHTHPTPSGTSGAPTPTPTGA